MTSATRHAQSLRRQQTDAEKLLWLRLRDRRLHGWKFKRQVPIDKFIADFCCADGKLVIELDGGQHAERFEQDKARTAILSSCGYSEKYRRCAGGNSFHASAVRADPPSPHPSPRRGEGAVLSEYNVRE